MPGGQTLIDALVNQTITEVFFSLWNIFLRTSHYQILFMEMLNDSPVRPGRRRGVARVKKHSLKADMTPMVDLGFLLIAFFVMTAKLSEPVVVKLNMPHDGPPIKLGMSNALTVILDKDNTIWYYYGDWETAFANNEINKTTYDHKNGIGKIIRERQQQLDILRQSDPSLEGREGLMLLIKSTKEARYGNVIDLLDETLINNVKKHAIIDPETEELGYISQHQ
jgi:biopolymer transport protein ExbD